MKIIDFGQFSFEKYNISNVSVIKQRNNWTLCDVLSGRKYNGFVLVTEGNCTYNWQDNEVKLSQGSLIYLPKNSHHTVRAPLKSLEFFRVSFTAADIEDGEETVFSEQPVVITHTAPQSVVEHCSELVNLTLRPHTDFKTMSSLCRIIDFCISSLNSSTKKGIDLALSYIKEHCMEEINLSMLASECYMSYSHLFRTFKQKFGVTPIEYKNSLRIEKAKKLLLDYDLSVGEIAERLGFEGACYFTRAFKKQVGISPLSYRKAESSNR